MELHAIILNVLKYTDKKTNKDKLRIGYILSDENSFQNTDKFKGYSELSYFCDDLELFQKIDKSFILNNCIFTFDEVSYPSNPLRKYLKLIDIRVGK